MPTQFQTGWFVGNFLPSTIGGDVLSEYGPQYVALVADVPGERASLVVVGCHLDSTAARDPGFTPARDAARGADESGF